MTAGACVPSADTREERLALSVLKFGTCELLIGPRQLLVVGHPVALGGRPIDGSVTSAEVRLRGGGGMRRVVRARRIVRTRHGPADAGRQAQGGDPGRRGCRKPWLPSGRPPPGRLQRWQGAYVPWAGATPLPPRLSEGPGAVADAMPCKARFNVAAASTGQ